MISADQTMIRHCDLAKELGISRITLWRLRLARPEIEGAQLTRSWYSVTRLRDARILPPAQPFAAVEK